MTLLNVATEPPPEGYRYQWKLDPAWKIADQFQSQHYKCRGARGCTAKPVAFLRRSWGGAGSGDFRRWFYCAGHLYGRVIANGEVLQRVLTENE